MVIWIIGLSASGKTTLGSRLYQVIKRAHPNTVFIDGDMVRDVMGNDLGHTIADRRRNAERISRLCHHLDQQGIHVVCAILSLFHESQQWNRAHFSSYKEVYLKASLETLQRREYKGLYAGALRGEIKDVVGVDIPFPDPYAPDVVVDNNVDGLNMEVLARRIADLLEVDLKQGYRYTRRNLLDEREKYQYSEYEGVAFLASYEAQRSATRQRLQEKIGEFQQRYGASEKRHPWVSKLGIAEEASVFLRHELPAQVTAPDREDVRNTRQFLYNVADSLLVKNSLSDLSGLLTLVHKFEVTKRIYDCYHTPFNKHADAGYRDLALYGLFGLVLSQAYQHVAVETQYSLVNALIKVNDILASVVPDLCTPLELLLAYVSMREEHLIYQKLSNPIVA